MFVFIFIFSKRSLAKFDLAVSKIKEEAGKAADTGAALKTSLGKLFDHACFFIRTSQLELFLRTYLI